MLERDYQVDPLTVPKGKALKSYLDLAKGRQVWTFGNGSRGQLGHGDNNNKLVLNQIQGFKNIIEVSCGGNHTAMIDSSGQVWTFGFGQLGQLGYGDNKNKLVPTPIQGFNKTVEVSCGGFYTAITMK